VKTVAALAGLSALLWGGPAGAQSERVIAPDWALGAPGGEVAVASLATASLAAYLIPQRRGAWGAWSSREANVAIGLASDFTGAFFGTVILGAQTYAFESGYYADAGVPEPFARSLRTSLIDAESVLLATGVTLTIKRLAGRCRPRSWHDGKCGSEDIDYDAFPSGHTAPVAAIAGARLLLAMRTPGGSALRFGALGVAEAATLATMALRVAAGAHSWEDVGAGLIVGHVTGVAIAALHPTLDLTPAPGAVPAPAAGGTVFAWSGTF
jgi:membrane-associated phospholipid phosphatase